MDNQEGNRTIIESLARVREVVGVAVGSMGVAGAIDSHESPGVLDEGVSVQPVRQIRSSADLSIFRKPEGAC